MLFHHLVANQGDPYLRASMSSFATRAQLESYLEACPGGHRSADILRTRCAVGGIAGAGAGVWRRASLPVEEVVLDPPPRDAAEQLRKRFNPRHVRVDVRQPPVLQVKIARDQMHDRWLLLMLFHHLAYDGMTVEIMKAEIRAFLEGTFHLLPRQENSGDFVAGARLAVSQRQHEAFFRRNVSWSR